MWEAKAKGSSPVHPFATTIKKSTYALHISYPKPHQKSDMACHLPGLIARLCRNVLKDFFGVCIASGARQPIQIIKDLFQLISQMNVLLRV